jgi:putative oxidoreductase
MSTVARYLLGLAFVVFSLNYFVPFLPQPSTPPPAEAGAFLAAFVGSHFLALVKAIELACGLLLLANRLVPLALTLLAPILVGITAFHVLLEPSGLPIPVVLVGLELVLAWAYRAAFAPMLRVRNQPARLARTPAPASTHAAIDPGAAS